MLLVLVLGGATSARAQDPEGLTGRYKKEGGELLLMEGGNETRVRYEAAFEQGASVGTCECPLVVKRKTGSRWSLEGAGSSDKWTLDIEPTRLVLESKTPACCGAGWPGRVTFERSAVRGPSTCEVKAPRAYFFASEEARSPRKAYVVAGDKVEVLLPGSEPRRVPARFKGARKTMVGLLERDQLECPRRGTTQAAIQPVEAERLQPLAGRWISLTRKGEGFILFKPCSAHTRSFTIRPASGELEVELGQETTLTKVTGLSPGAAAGSYMLELTHPSGNTETVTWKELDARKGLVSVSSADLFSRSHEYVREDKKSAYPVEEETGCDEER